MCLCGRCMRAHAWSFCLCKSCLKKPEKSWHHCDSVRGWSQRTACCKWLLIHVLPLCVCVCVCVCEPWLPARSAVETWGVNKELCCHPTADQTHTRRREDDKQSKQNLISGAITSVCLIFGTCCRKPRVSDAAWLSLFSRGENGDYYSLGLHSLEMWG